MKYKNIKAVAEAFRTGELDGNHYKLVLDNDSSWLQFNGSLPEGIKRDGAAAEAFLDEKNDECHKWFSGNGYGDLKEACEAAGIPCEWC